MRTRNLFMFQFEEPNDPTDVSWEDVCQRAGLLQKAELIAINGLMSKPPPLPVCPQGNFGNHAGGE